MTVYVKLAGWQTYTRRRCFKVTSKIMKLDNTFLSSLAFRDLNPICKSSNGKKTRKFVRKYK